MEHEIIAIHDPVFIIKYSIVGVVFGLTFFYGLWSLISRRFLKVDVYELLLYMTVGFLVAVYTEPMHDYIYKYFFGEFLWIYQVWPILDGVSSGIAFITWPFYGYNLYFFTQTLKRYEIRFPFWLKASIPAIDGVPFDMIANFASLALFNIIFFYYPRTELWHLSSWWVIPFYWVSGVLYAYTLRAFLKKERRWKYPILCYAIGCLGIVVFEIFY